MVKQEISNYQKALNYAFHLNKELFRDITHDAFMRWFEKTGKNLFDEHERIVISVVKRTWWSNYIGPSRIMYRGKRYGKWFKRMDEIGGDGVGGGDSTPSYRKQSRWFMSRPALYNAVTPEDELIAKDLDEWFRRCDNETRLDIYLYAIQGYTQSEISKIMELSPQLINYYFKRMQYMASLLN